RGRECAPGRHSLDRRSALAAGAHTDALHRVSRRPLRGRLRPDLGAPVLHRRLPRARGDARHISPPRGPGRGHVAAAVPGAYGDWHGDGDSAAVRARMRSIRSWAKRAAATGAAAALVLLVAAFALDRLFPPDL